MAIITPMKIKDGIINMLIVACIIAMGGLYVYHRGGGYTHKEDTSYYANGQGLDEKKSYDIYCFGDEATAGVDTDDSYPYLLGKGLYSEAYMIGQNGYSTRDLAFYTGSSTFYVRDITIPKEGTCGVKIYSRDGENVYLTINATPVSIEGIAGTLRIDDNGNVLFTRSSKGDKKEINGRTPIEVKNKLSKVNKKGIAIIMTGNYDQKANLSRYSTISYQKAILNHFGFKKYIIVSATSKRLNPEIDELNDALLNEYGVHFFDFRSYILTHGLEDASLKVLEGDDKLIADGYIPSQLLVEENQAAGNIYFNKLLRDQLISRMKKLKYID